MLIYKSIDHKYKLLRQRMYAEINIALCAIPAFIILTFKWYSNQNKHTIRIKLKYDEKNVIFI